MRIHSWYCTKLDQPKLISGGKDCAKLEPELNFMSCDRLDQAFYLVAVFLTAEHFPKGSGVIQNH